jgi:hypothetical protein
LKNPKKELEKSRKDILPFPQDKCPFPAGWIQSFNDSKTKLERLLFIGHPVMLKVLGSWHNFKEQRFIDLKEIQSQKESFRIGGFRSMLLVQSEKCRDKLLKGLV